MIILLNKAASEKEIDALKAKLFEENISFHLSQLSDNSCIVIKNTMTEQVQAKIGEMEGVLEIHHVTQPYQLASRSWKSQKTTFDVRGVEIGGDTINLIAGPCAVESEEQIYKIAEYLHSRNLQFIRGGAYKPRTSPYSFQGLGTEGLKYLKKAADKFNLRIVTEVLDLSLLDEVAEYADILQIGARNMDNYYLLRQLGKIDKPVLLKRGMNAKIPEWLMAAEYILSGGNEKVILCERGIRTFDDSVRNTLDVAAIPIIKELSHLPIFADPSHGTGIRTRVIPLALASVAAGTDGLIIEIHSDPENALSDGYQSMYLEQFDTLLDKLKPLAGVMDRNLDFEIEYTKFNS